MVDKSRLIRALRDYYVHSESPQETERRKFLRDIPSFNAEHARAFDTGWDRGWCQCYDDLEEEVAKVLEASDEENGEGRSGMPLDLVEIARRRMQRLNTLEKENVRLRNRSTY